MRHWIGCVVAPLVFACGGRVDSSIDASSADADAGIVPPSAMPDSTPPCDETTEDFATWRMSGANPSLYQGGLDPGVTCNGTPSLFLRSTSQASGSEFGTMMTTQGVSAYAGKRVRLSGWVESASLDAWAGLWMRVDGPNQQMLAFDNMANRPITGTTPFTKYDVVLDVASDAVDIAYGILLSGNGEVWLDGAEVEVVDDSVPPTGS